MEMGIGSPAFAKFPYYLAAGNRDRVSVFTRLCPTDRRRIFWLSWWRQNRRVTAIEVGIEGPVVVPVFKYDVVAITGTTRFGLVHASGIGGKDWVA